MTRTTPKYPGAMTPEQKTKRTLYTIAQYTATATATAIFAIVAFWLA